MLTETPDITTLNDLTPGVYRYGTLAALCGVSRTTAEKFLTRYALEEVDISYQGRQVRGVRLEASHCERIQLDYGVQTPLRAGNETPSQTPYVTPVEPLIQRVLDLSEQLMQQSVTIQEQTRKMLDMERALAEKSTALVLASREQEVMTEKIKELRDKSKQKPWFWPF